MSKLGLVLLVTVGWSSTVFAAPTISVNPSGPVNMTARVLDPAIATQTFTITNSGDGTLDITALAPSGSADFSIPSPPTLPAHLTTNSLQVTVQFNPSVSGVTLGSLDITSTDAGSPTSIVLQGSGTNAIINAADFDFGIVPDGTSSPASVLISNIGGAPKGPLTVTSATITNGGGVIAFGVGNGCNGGTTCTFTQPFTVTSGTISAPVVCAPGATATVAIAANITFASDSDADPTANPIASLTCTPGRPQISTDSPVAFGTIELTQTSGALQITAKNTGNEDMVISNAVLTAGAADFSVTAGSAPTGAQSTTVPPGNTVTWNATCHPSTVNGLNGTFQIMSNVPGSVLTNVALTCTGQGGIAVVNPTSLNFGGVRVGDSPKLPYHLQNTGNLPITNVAAVLDVTTVGYSLDPTTPVPTTLAVGANVPLNIIFAPQAGTDGGPATVTFSGTWGASNRPTSAVLSLQGDGLVAGFDLTPNPLDFGDLRFDTTPTKTFCITNTDEASLTIQNNISISPHAGTASGEFSITGLKLQTTCGTGGAATTLPRLLTSGQSIEVTVKADPANRIGAMAADLTVTSDLTMNPTRTILLQGNSTTAAMTVVPMTLDFGPTDIDAGPVSLPITITNTSADASLDLSGFTKTASTVYSLTLPGGTTTLAPGMQLVLNVTYHPTVEKPAGQLDSMTVTNNIAGILNGPTIEMLTIQGRGIDRHIDVSMSPQIPDTFRNPGDMAPIIPIQIKDTGEAILHVSAVMVTGGPVWTLVDGDAMDIAGGTSVDIHVKFAPTVAGPAPAGELAIMNNDNGDAMAVVDLRGNGLNRSVDLLPNGSGIDMGYVGVGVPVTKDGVLQVASMDPTNSFQIRTITLDDTTGQFAIDNPPTDAALPPFTQQQFSVTFTPDQEGDFSTTATLFLDMDPTPQDTVLITGHAVFVDAHGSGGCSSGGATDGAMIVIVIVLALVTMRRRRAVAIVVIALPLAVRADNVDLSVFHPTPATTSDGFQLQSADVGANGDWVASAVVSLATDPLVFTAYDRQVNADGSVTLVPINDDHAVHRRTQYDLGLAYAFLGRFEAGARMPLYTQTGETITDPMQFGSPPASGTARGDLTLHTKARLLKTDPAILAAELQLTLPTATEGQYTGLDKPSGRVLALGTFMPFSRLTLTANAGAVIRAKAQLGNVEQGSGMAWGGGASFRLLDQLWIAGEIFGELIPSGTHDHDAMQTAQTLSPIEWLGGFNYRPDRRFTLGIAVGRGVTTGFGAPDLRGVVAMTFAPGSPELAPIHPEIHVIDGDRDGDGIPDSKDKCPDEPEDFDMFEDTDGCPDPDNDHDGIPDAVDKCPLDPEDFDGFQDADGCPDPDNDGDGIPDIRDKCPNEPEDKDGFEDLDGCPDPDNDHDGIPDVKDKCPNEPETINGFQDDDGCPDKGDPLVVVSPDRLETMESIQFSGTKVAKGSLNLLGQVAANLRAHVEISRLRITAHVQPTRNSDKDQELSDKRAQAVRDWLVQWGIDPQRLEARGFGGEKPLVPATQRNAAVVNDRLEFIILERK